MFSQMQRLSVPAVESISMQEHPGAQLDALVHWQRLEPLQLPAAPEAPGLAHEVEASPDVHDASQ